MFWSSEMEHSPLNTNVAGKFHEIAQKDFYNLVELLIFFLHFVSLYFFPGKLIDNLFCRPKKRSGDENQEIVNKRINRSKQHRRLSFPDREVNNRNVVVLA